LFLAQVFSVTLYSYGLAESLRIIWPGVPIQPVTFVIVLMVGGLAFSGAGLALRTQIPLMVFVGISLVALAIGSILRASGAGVPLDMPSGEVGFWVGFAIFFPAVTGVMAGLGLSGDLKDPGRAIPVGSILAVLTGFAIYLIVPVLLAVGASPEELRGDSLIWLRIAPLGAFLILPGLWGAIFSSAVGSMLSAPRSFQALAMDRIVPKFLGGFSAGRKGLIPGLVISVLISLGAVFLGGLNAVAKLVSIFFLTTYGTINIVAALETLSGDPSWRPKLRVPWAVSLVGGLACILVIFLISPTAGFIAIFAEFLVWYILSRRERRARWGDARRGIYESLIRWALIQLA
jgi:amino acid transporter